MVSRLSAKASSASGGQITGFCRAIRPVEGGRLADEESLFGQGPVAALKAMKNRPGWAWGTDARLTGTLPHSNATLLPYSGRRPEPFPLGCVRQEGSSPRYRFGNRSKF
jgi:hypothetical protein